MNTRSIGLWACLAFGAAAAMSAIASAADYYVDPGGDDANPGSESQPWRTLAKAGQTAAAGDTVFIRSGTYAELLVPGNSGTDGNFITFTAAAGETVTIDGADVTMPYEPPWGGLVEIDGKSCIRISGLRVVNSASAGIFAWNESDRIVIENNATYNTFSSGIGVWGCSNVTVSGNDVELACNDGSQECISISGTDTFEVSYNNVHDGGPGSNGGEGIDAKEACVDGRIFGNSVHDLSRLGIYVDAWDSSNHDNEVYDNTSFRNDSGFAVSSENGGQLERIRIHDNVAYDNRGVGFWVSGWGVDGAAHLLRDIEVFSNTAYGNESGLAVVTYPGSLLENVRFYDNVAYGNTTRGLWIAAGDELTGETLIRGMVVVNNTFAGNGTAGWGGGITIDTMVAETIVFRNNILSDNLSFQIATGSELTVDGLTIDFNLIDGFRGDPGETYGTDHVEGDPLFVDAAAADFHLQASSPAIDSGTSAEAPAVDFDGNVRPQGAGFDIGAFEHGLPPPDEAETIPEPVPDRDDAVEPVTDDGLDEESGDGGGGCGCSLAVG
jgi:hypothetical protein